MEINAPSTHALDIFPYDADNYNDFKSSYDDLQQLHNMLNLKHITTTVQVIVFTLRTSDGISRYNFEDIFNQPITPFLVSTVQ